MKYSIPPTWELRTNLEFRALLVIRAKLGIMAMLGEPIQDGIHGHVDDWGYIDY